jgi:hypothetical protein
VHDVFELDDETPVMVMDLLSGETLAQRIDTLGKLSLEETASILLPVVSAVGTAHSRGVVHRECLSGQLPVYGENLGQVMKVLTSQDIVPLAKVAPFVPDEVTRLVDRMLTRAVDKRPSDLREVLEVLRRHSNVRVRDFSIARSQPPPHEPKPTPDAAARKTPVHAQDSATVLESGGRPAKPHFDTASPHAVSLDAPRSRRIVVSLALVLGALAVGAIGWQLGRARDVGVAPTPAAPRDRVEVTATAPAPPPATPPPATVAAPSAPTVETPVLGESAEKIKAAPAVRVPAKAAPTRADAGAKVVDSDASKSNQKRAGGLIEDVPF